MSSDGSTGAGLRVQATKEAQSSSQVSFQRSHTRQCPSLMHCRCILVSGFFMIYQIWIIWIIYKAHCQLLSWSLCLHQPQKGIYILMTSVAHVGKVGQSAVCKYDAGRRKDQKKGTLTNGEMWHQNESGPVHPEQSPHQPAALWVPVPNLML